MLPSDRADKFDSYPSRADFSFTRPEDTTAPSLDSSKPLQRRSPRMANEDLPHDTFMAFFSQVLPMPYPVVKDSLSKDTARIETTGDSNVPSKVARSSKARPSQAKHKGIVSTSKVTRSPRRQKRGALVGQAVVERNARHLRNVKPDIRRPGRPSLGIPDIERSAGSDTESRRSVSEDWSKDALRSDHSSDVPVEYTSYSTKP